MHTRLCIFIYRYMSAHIRYKSLTHARTFMGGPGAQVWSVLSGECLQTLSGHDALVTMVSFSEEATATETCFLKGYQF